MPTHSEAIAAVMEILVDAENGVIASVDEIDAVGHRVLHGGMAFTESCLIDDAVIEAIKSLDKDGKGVPEDKKADLKTNEDKATELRAKKDELISKYAAGNDTVKQLIDIALLGNGLLKGEALSNFLKRSVSLL